MLRDVKILLRVWRWEVREWNTHLWLDLASLVTFWSSSCTVKLAQVLIIFGALLVYLDLKGVHRLYVWIFCGTCNRRLHLCQRVSFRPNSRRFFFLLRHILRRRLMLRCRISSVRHCAFLCRGDCHDWLLGRIFGALVLAAKLFNDLTWHQLLIVISSWNSSCHHWWLIQSDHGSSATHVSGSDSWGSLLSQSLRISVLVKGSFMMMVCTSYCCNSTTWGCELTTRRWGNDRCGPLPCWYDSSTCDIPANIVSLDGGDFIDVWVKMSLWDEELVLALLTGDVVRFRVLDWTIQVNVTSANEGIELVLWSTLSSHWSPIRLALLQSFVLGWNLVVCEALRCDWVILRNSFVRGLRWGNILVFNLINDLFKR